GRGLAGYRHLRRRSRGGVAARLSGSARPGRAARAGRSDVARTARVDRLSGPVRTREVFIFVRRGEEFLVLRRSERQGGYWHGVAGGIEEGETPAEAAGRELSEETGLQAAPNDLERSYAYSGVTVHCFHVEAPPGWEPRLDWGP